MSKLSITPYVRRSYLPLTMLSTEYVLSIYYAKGSQKLLETCENLRRQQTSLKQSSGFIKNNADKHIKENMSSALREAEKFVRPELKDKEVEEKRRFLNYLFFGETTGDSLPVATSVCIPPEFFI